MRIGDFYAASRAAYDAWDPSSGDKPPATTRFPAGAASVTFYIAYSGAKPQVDTYQVVILSGDGTARATGHVTAFTYAAGAIMRAFTGSWADGRYSAELLVDKTVVRRTAFSVGP